MKDNRIIIICARHDIARDWARKRGYAEGTFKTITRASSLLGLHKGTNLLYLDTGLEFPDSAAIMRELRTRFTNAHVISTGLQLETLAQKQEPGPGDNEPGRVDCHEGQD